MFLALFLGGAVGATEIHRSPELSLFFIPTTPIGGAV